ncbi:hypothetical protein TREES_T100016169 [Tupaia chinensis]|uniref:Uncharacterized protein n=1 Tax=Tupaia chinensis TaxID=246437 RepID=L9JN73_TUPCH|nr:hypothetical protein TREES_T100016169 [Tupaia chinensis]
MCGKCLGQRGAHVLLITVIAIVAMICSSAVQTEGVTAFAKVNGKWDALRSQAVPYNHFLRVDGNDMLMRTATLSAEHAPSYTRVPVLPPVLGGLLLTTEEWSGLFPRVVPAPPDPPLLTQVQLSTYPA